MLKNVTDLASPDYSKGLSTIANILAVGKQQTPNCMNVMINFDGSVEKRLGSVTNNGVVITGSGGATWTTDGTLSLSTGLQVFWNLDEPAGTRFPTVGTLNLLDNNNVISAGGIRNQAALFVAANSQYLVVSNTAAIITGNTSFTISTWVYLTTQNAIDQQTIISKRDGHPAYGVDSNCVLLLHFEGTNGLNNFTDSSPSAHVMTAAGSATTSTLSSKFGLSSALFQAPGVVTTPSSTDFDYGTGDFTVDMWVRPATGGAPLSQGLIDRGNAQFTILPRVNGVNGLDVYIEGATKISSTTFPVWNIGAWQHIALVRSSSVLRFFHNGSSLFGDIASTENISDTNIFCIGSANISGIFQWLGGIDELRIIKGKAFWTTSATFTVPPRAYYPAASGSLYEYWLHIDTDNKATWEISSGGVAANVTVKANSFGVLSTATWYNVVAWHDSANGLAGISVNLHANSSAYTSGIKAGSAPFVLGAISNGAASFLGGRIDDVGYWAKVLTAGERISLYNGGSGNTFSLGFDQTPWASFDFGASGSVRWLTVAAGTGVFASSDLGVNWTTIGTSRTATYQYFDRSKNVLVATSEAYDTPLVWPGSGGTFMVNMNSNAPLAKYSVNFQGFSILLNTATRKRGFFYQDENTQLTGTWANSFDLPSSADDEITAAFVLRRYLYISTRYSLFRVSYVGGNPDWSFQQLKAWGYVPRTVKKVTLGQVGEVAIGEDWDRRIRVFDGADDKIISTDIEDDNGLCDYATSKVSYGGSGLIVHFAEVDPLQYVYKLACGIGTNTTDITHFINFDPRTNAFYPYSNMKFATMAVAESGGQRYIMAFDKSGFCHLTNSGNLDSGKTPIDDVFDSPFAFDKSPSNLSKSHKIDLYFGATSSDTVHFYDRTNFSKSFVERTKFTLSDTTNFCLIKQQIDVPTSFNVYQFRISSSMNTADPWKLIRGDNFLNGMGIGGIQ